MQKCLHASTELRGGTSVPGKCTGFLLLVKTHVLEVQAAVVSFSCISSTLDNHQSACSWSMTHPLAISNSFAYSESTSLHQYHVTSVA